MEKFQKCPLYAKSISAYIKEESLLLFFKESGRVYGLEKEHAALFLQIDELLQKHEEGSIQTFFPQVPAKYIKSLIDLRLSRYESDDMEEYEPPLGIGEFVEDEKERVCYDTGRILFYVAFENREVREKIEPIFAHLCVKRGGSKKVNVDFSLKDSKWQILFNGRPVAAAAPKETLPLTLQENMIIVHYQSEPYLTAIHAGAVAIESRAVIFPGSSGSGKSTLTAALAAEGHSLFSDEIALLDCEGELSSIPFCMNIKEGSWGVLRNTIPALSQKESYLRFDGRRVKFVPPLNLSQKKSPVDMVIFPKYRAGSDLLLKRLSACETLKRIKEAGYQLGGELSERSFEKILSNVLDAPAYLLEYGSLEEAKRQVERLVRG